MAPTIQGWQGDIDLLKWAACYCKSHHCACFPQADTITQAADDFGVSDEIDGEYKTTAAVARTVQGMPGVMDAQSRAARREGAQVAAEMVEGAEEDAHKEQKWQFFMQKHFGGSFLTDTMNCRLTPCGTSITKLHCSSYAFNYLLSHMSISSAGQHVVQRRLQHANCLS